MENVEDEFRLEWEGNKIKAIRIQSAKFVDRNEFYKHLFNLSWKYMQMRDLLDNYDEYVKESNDIENDDEKKNMLKVLEMQKAQAERDIVLYERDLEEYDKFLEENNLKKEFEDFVKNNELL